MIYNSDIVVGLVLHLDPVVFQNEGGTTTVNLDVAVEGGHFFRLLDDQWRQVEVASSLQRRWSWPNEDSGRGPLRSFQMD